MRREISPEMLNYNKFPGPSFVVFDNHIQSDGISLELVDNYREGFKLENFQQRFSEILLKYDYILGDWSSDELRLRGFYKDDRVVKTDSKISRLDDYLKEYCNFGCAYFLLANPEPREVKSDEGDRRRRRDNRKRRSSRSPINPNESSFKVREDNNQSHRHFNKKGSKKKQEINDSKEEHYRQHFTIRKKEN
ncbi:YutD family protein [Streptococcus dentasini]